ncbi:Protein kinase domain [Fusarium oxysporum f. sp. vasinfectum]|nr:Protein kinase domain [Fusarium oxysporum f. sp. vasinfectum]WKT44181.1 Protein kinase domain [Fusarium oxysporum f. sp. vasinfectum]
MECLKDKFVGGALLKGRYQTISPLNHGSFGMVFKAQDLVTNEPVAIKCLTKRSACPDADSDFAIDEKSEEQALHSRLGTHRNIVNLIDSFETDSHIYLVLEFCGQGDLYEAIRKGHGPLETEHVRQFMIELIDAVDYMHSKGVYHRDIKPENIFLTQDGAMKLGDFGLATTEKWSYEMTVGSDRYMAPEQFDSAGAGYSPAEADIWAIGICLLNILFSRNPFTTPTEADPLFLDYSRDKQSLFDVFPSMSQDTYEVLVQCMNLDPRRRSLEGAREALLRVVTFTTDDEDDDEYCGAESPNVATANREPLRTPSIQSPAVDTGAFPWAKALHGTTHLGRQLSVIPDDESYTEDLFPKSEATTTDWCSANMQTPMSSVYDSHLGASMKSLAIKPTARFNRSSATAGSLPINMAKPMPAMSMVFGRRQETPEPESASHTHDIKGDVDDDLVADGFFFQEAPTPKPQQITITPHYSHSPMSKPRSSLDKWAALGERRRGQTATLDSIKSVDFSKPRRHNFGFGYNKSYEAGVWDHSNYHHKFGAAKERSNSKECPWNKGRDWNWRRDRRTDLGDVEWVGGW